MISLWQRQLMFDVGPHTVCCIAVKISVNVSRCMSTYETESCSLVSTRSPWKQDSVSLLHVILSPVILSFTFFKVCKIAHQVSFSVYKIKRCLFISFSSLQVFFLCLSTSWGLQQQEKKKRTFCRSTVHSYVWALIHKFTSGSTVSRKTHTP